MDFARWSLRDIRIYAAALSFLLSIWCMITADAINFDGIVYLRAAELIGSGQWAAGVEHYKWPLYSILIAGIGQIPGLSYEHAAQLINALMAALLVAAFVTVIAEVGGQQRALFAAAAVILLYPGLARYRAAVVRDLGYLAFYMLALVFLARQARDSSWRHVPGWLGSMVAAALFRIEGLVVLALLPLILGLRRGASSYRRVAIVLLLPVPLTLGYLVFAWWLGGFSIAAGSAADTLALAGDFGSRLLRMTGERIEVIRNTVLNDWSADNAWVVFAAALAAVFVSELISRLTPLHTVLVVHAWYRGLAFPLAGARTLWYGLLAIQAAVVCAILFYYFFLTSRFPLALALTLLLAAPFSLAALHEQWQRRRAWALRKNWVFPSVCALLLLTGAYALTHDALTSNHKRHVKAAGHWIREHTPADARVFSNEPRLTFYAGRHPPTERIRRYAWAEVLDLLRQEAPPYDYLAIRIHHRHAERETAIERLIGLAPIEVFANRKGDRVLLFKLER